MEGRKKIHLVGIGGVGMSALAQALLDEGHVVSGSDRYRDSGWELNTLERLERAGAVLTPQDGSGVVDGLSCVVVSTAIESDNPDLRAAEDRGLPVIHRAGMLARLAEGRTCIAVSGTSGKTTVTGMLGWILEQSGRDPTVVNGGELVSWASHDRLGSVRRGSSNLVVIEADESDESFLIFNPDWAIITNISEDHFGLPRTISLFHGFAKRVKTGIVCPRAVATLADPGLGAEGAAFYVPEATIAEDDEGWQFIYKEHLFRVDLPGRHNAENALLATALCDLLGVPLDVIESAVRSFRGIRRRLELVGSVRGVTVIDDYAHNPAKLRAAWAATSARGRTLGLWRPHGFRPLASMMSILPDVFADSMRPGDELYVLPVYYAGGTADQTVTSNDLVTALRQKNVPATLVQDYDDALRCMLASVREGDIVLCMGARDPGLPAFARRVADALAAG